MIKNNVTNSVLSYYNPIISLKPEIRKKVNSDFLGLILHRFFENRGGIENFEPLDVDKLKTEIEFNENNEPTSYVKSYLYQEIIQEINKNKEGKVEFKPKYVITFDHDLTPFIDKGVFYPYKQIFNEADEDTLIHYGNLLLGNIAVLYYISIDLQRIIQFIKTVDIKTNSESEDNILKIKYSSELQRNRQIDTIIRNKEIEQNKSGNQDIENGLSEDIARLKSLKKQELQGAKGTLRINLAWNTTDDLDLHVKTPNGEISYNNKTVEYKGIIGELDIDKNANNNLVSNPQENIFWNEIPQGFYKIFVNFYTKREKNKVPFTLSIIQENGEGRVYDRVLDFDNNRKMDIASFELIDNKLEIKELIDN